MTVPSQPRTDVHLMLCMAMGCLPTLVLNKHKTSQGPRTATPEMNTPAPEKMVSHVPNRVHHSRKPSPVFRPGKADQ